MHGVDWLKMARKYGKVGALPEPPADLDFIFGELVGELNAVTATSAGGTLGASTRPRRVARRRPPGDPQARRYVIKKIYRGENWNPDTRSPLNPSPGSEVKEGEYLIALTART